MTTSKARQAYVNAIAANYVRLPGTPLRASRGDRRLAAALYDQGVPLRAVWAAFVMAAARWALRGPMQRKLEPIRTLYYFLPTIDEVLARTLAPDYVLYLASKLEPMIRDKEARLPPSHRGQEPAKPHGR
jgi:hypothetical protein